MFEYKTLQELIDLLEYGTNIHISILFLTYDCGSSKNIPDFSHTIHSKPFCNCMKMQAGGLERCMECRQRAIERTVRIKRTFGGICTNGIYEICHPILTNGEVTGIIFVGNIVLDETILLRKIKHYRIPDLDGLRKSIEFSQSSDIYISMAEMLEGYIRLMANMCPFRTGEEQLHPAVKMLRDFVDHQFGRNLSLPAIANLYHFNEKYLGRLFKHQSGMSFNEYLNTRRLDAACKLLAEKNATVTQVAMETGFNTVSYFNRKFREKYGITPTEYRAEYKDKLTIQTG